MSQYLVIGGTGYLGRTIVAQLKARGDSVMVFDRQADSELVAWGIPFILGDIRSAYQLKRAFKLLSPGARVIHAASLITLESKPHPELSAVNIRGTENIVRLCRKYQVGRLGYISTVHALPFETSGRVKREISRFLPIRVVGQYAKSKAMASQIVYNAACQGLDAVIVHPTGIVGPGKGNQGETTPMIQAFLAGKLRFAIAGGHDFVDVRDVADGVFRAMERGQRGESYILSGGFYTTQENLNMVAKLAGKKPPRIVLPAAVFRFVAPIAEYGFRLLKRRPLLTKYMAFTLSHFELYSYQKAARELGYQPRSMWETLRDTLDQLMKEPDELSV